MGINSFAISTEPRSDSVWKKQDYFELQVKWEKGHV